MERATALSLARQLQYECEGEGDVTLNRQTLKIVLDAFIEDWAKEQEKVRQSFGKVK